MELQKDASKAANSNSCFNNNSAGFGWTAAKLGQPTGPKSLSLKFGQDEIVKCWWPKVKCQGHCDLMKHILVCVANGIR